MIPVRLEGDAIGREKYLELQRENHNELWVPNTHESEYRAYLAYLEKTKQAAGNNSQLSSQPANSREREKTANIAKGILRSTEIDPESKSARLAHLAQEILKELSLSDKVGSSALAEPAARCHSFADEFLLLSSEEDSIYEAVIAMRSLEDPTYHSAFTGSLAAILASAAGESNPIKISQLITAATFHDLGLSFVSAQIICKTTAERTPAEQAEYESHVQKGVDLLNASTEKVPHEVLRMVHEHHESPDGKGFPNRRQEEELYPSSKFLIIANQFASIWESSTRAGATTPAQTWTQMKNELSAWDLPDSLFQLLYPS